MADPLFSRPGALKKEKRTGQKGAVSKHLQGTTVAKLPNGCECADVPEKVRYIPSHELIRTGQK